MKALFGFLKSVKLAVALILLITVLSILSTLVGWSGFFSSAFFLVPAFAFALNVALCTADRLFQRLKTGAKPRYGPDLIHIGLLILIAGGLLSFALRREKLYYLSEGDQAAIDPHTTVSLLSFEFRKYDNGMPEAWISTVRVARDGKTVVPSYPIAVNRPLRLPGVRLYQTSWASEGTLTMTDARGASYLVRTGEGLQDGASVWYFSGVERTSDAEWSAEFQEWREKRMVSSRTVKPGESVGPLTAQRVEGRLQTGLKAVSDPGAFPAIGAFAVIGVGLALSFLQKGSDERA